MFYKIFISTLLLVTIIVVQGKPHHGEGNPEKDHGKSEQDHGKPPTFQGLSGRIIGGVATTIRDIPYQCSLWNGTLHFCGAAILSDEWIITAAHCMNKMPSYQVRINSTTSDSGGTLLDVVDNIVHPFFNEAYSYDYDVALIKVKKFVPTGIHFAKWPKCDAPKCNHDAENIIQVSGWGENNIVDKIKRFILQKVRIPIVTLKECKSIYQYDSEITDHMFCAGYLKEGGKDSCQGDSGGPATCKNDLVGVVSFGYECAKPGEPGIYTDLLDESIQDWIEKTAGVSNKCKVKQSLSDTNVTVATSPVKRRKVQQQMLERE